MLPDYDHSILSTASALCEYYGVQCDYPPLQEVRRALQSKPQHVFLILADGLGDVVLREMLPERAWLRRHIAATVTSVFPPTTTAATTAYYSTRSPLEHGWLGWHLYFDEIGEDVTTFFPETYHTRRKLEGPPPATTLLPYETLFERIRTARPEVRLHSLCPFDAYYERGAHTIQRPVDFEQGCAQMRRIARMPEESFTLFYWPQPDSAMHDHGAHSREAKAQYLLLDHALEQLAARIDDSLLIVTSDHGLLDISEDIFVDRIPALMEMLVHPPSLDARAAAFFVKPDRHAEFEAFFREHYSGDFLLLSREEVYRTGIFGRGRPHPRFDGFIGDYIACATGARAFHYNAPGVIPKPPLRAHHAGLCPEEMQVAVILKRTERSERSQ